MTGLYPYRWPTKLKKFGIEDQFLKILATKYEKEIPWQVLVRDSSTLIRYVENVMLPKFLDRAAFPHNEAGKNHLYISSNDVSLDTALNAEVNRDSPEIKTIKNIRLVEGDIVAKAALVKLINERKYLAFKAWIDMLDKEYSNEPVFKLLLLRPLFELSGRGMRRAVIEPSLDVIEWLHRRIERERVLPDENIATHYCLKLGMGSQKASSDGWQFIPSGRQNSAQLSAASLGSGWCIADRKWANNYLEDCEFYLLRSINQPVVALRVSTNSGRVIECRGRFNSSPDKWFVDIDIFLKTQSLDMYGRENIKEGFDSKSEDWWKDRIRLWPFAGLLAPSTIKAKLVSEIYVDLFKYAHFKNFHNLVQLLGVNLDQGFWRMLVEVNPYSYVNCPRELQSSPRIQEACLTGWKSLLNDDQMTAQLILTIPEFVRANARFQEAIGKNFPASLRDTIRKHPSTWSERENRFKLQNFLPATPGESEQVARERLVNVLLNNEDGIYTDDKFSDIERQREDFLIIREQAWTEAIQAHPPLWFALPVDLRNKENFQLTDQAPKNVDLDMWCLKVTAKPWLLTQQKGVPKSIRFHRCILEAYRDGWFPFLRKSPWRLWVPKGARRVYMSNALLADDHAINALAEGWKQSENKILNRWFQNASDRMRKLQALQVSVLRAICPRGIAAQNGYTIKVYKDIETRHDLFVKQKLPNTPFDKEIRSLLVRGIQVDVKP